VREAAVTVREDTPGHPRLVAYAAGADGLAAEALREGLRARLPGYMVPAACVTLAALPLTANGKVDLKALPAPERTAAEAVRRAPESALEKTVAAVWQEVLAVDQVGLDDNFFDRGGHSLLLVEVQGKLSERLGREIKIVDLFTYPTIGALARFLSRGEDRTAAAAQEERMVERWSRAGAGALGGTGTQPPIAIIGMAGRFPGGPGGLASFWAMLRDGREGISFFTDEELLAEGIDPRLLASPHYVKAGATLAGADLFDAEFFEILPREAEILDPQQRLLLECAAEALERAGYAGTERPVGVFAGASDSTYWLHNLATHPELTESAGLFAINLANSRDFVATRLSYELNLSGTSLTVQTACSTSLVAVHLACQSLIAGECELALAGGASVRAPQKSGHLYQPGGILSPDGHCRAFDARGEGTLGGQGVGLVVLKRLDEAIADGDPIHAVIRGSALTNDGLAKAGFTAPGLDGQAKAIRAAHRRAGVEPDSIGYVETHGTATPLGDLVEIAALTRAFRLGTERSGFCALGSVKTNIGHLDAAAGVAGLIKTVLALENAAIPPSLHFETPNPQIDFAASPFFVNRELRAWPRGNGAPRRAGVSSFGLGGTNAHVVLEEAPEREPSGPSRPWQVLLLSARTATALEQATDNLADHFEADPDQNLADAAYTLRVGRWPFAHRRAVVATSVEEAAAALRARDPKRVWSAVSEPASRPVAFLLPGVGDQYPGIARGLYRDEPVFRAEIDRCAELLLPHLGLDLRDALFAGDEDGETAATAGTDLRALLGRAKQEDGREAAARALLQETRIAQPAMFAVGYALARLWMSWGVQPQALLGYSLGEYTAACLAGVLELPDALALVAQRARLIGGLAPGAMLAVPLSEAATRALLGAELSLAAVNAPEVSVAAGPPAAIAELEARLAAAGTPGRRLQTEQAFHSSSMQPIAEALRELVRAVPLAPPRLPYLSNVTGTWIEPAQATDPDYWVRHLLSTVRFADGVAELWREPGRILLEMGPGQTLGSLALQQSADGGIVLSALRHERDRQPDQRFLLHTLGRLWLAGAAIDGSGFHRGERRRRVILPTYPFERRRFWIEAATAAPYARTEAPAPVPEKPADMAEWFHVPTWQRAPRRRRAAVLEGSWLVLCDPLGLGDRLARRLTDAGCTVETLAPQDAAGFDRWPARILHCWSLGAAPGPLSLPGLARKLMQRAGTVEICVIADGLCDVERHDALDVEKAALLGEVRALPGEHPGLTCRLIDIDAGEIGENLEARLLAEIAGPRAEPGPESIIALRGPHRWAPDLAPLPLAPVAGRPALLREGGAYLITGGRRDLASALAAHLARAAAVLEIAEDVADGPALRSALTAARQRLGRIDGVFHAAAPGEPAEAVRALESALAGDPPGFLALFSPLGDALGVGPAEGCAAAAVRSALARRSARGGMPVLAVAWSPRWDDPAEAAAAMQALDRILDSSLPEILVAPRGLAAARQPQPSDEGTEPPAPRAERSARPSLQTPYTAPATAVEETMAELWGELLGIAPIGVHDDFFQLGGHSLLGLQLTSRIQARLGVELPQGALFEAPTVAELAARVEEALQAGAGRPAPPLTPIAPELRQGPLPLSFAQQRLWFIDQLEPGKANYHIPVTLRAEGPLDAAGLALCLGEIVRRHEALRTVFAAAGDSPVQIVQPPAPFALPVIDLSGLPESRREALAPVLAAAEAAQPFDLARGPLLRGILLRMAAADHIAALTMHHIVSDGWSLGLLIREVGTLYRALLEGRPSPLPALPIQYADFAVWQSRWLDAAALAGLAEHWRRRLAGAPLQLDLPEAKPRPAVLSSRGASRQRRLAAPLPEQLRALGRRESASLFMTLLAPLFALLHARTGAADLVVGTDVAGRDQRATEGLIGFFIKQLPLRADLSGDPTLRELLGRVRETALEAYAHQDLPFDHLVEALRVKPSLQRSPIFQVKLVLQNAQQERLDLPDLTLRVVPLEADTAQLDLHWSAAEIGGELWLTLNYSTDLFDEPSIDRLLDQYEICLRALVERPEVRLGALAAELAQAERTRRAERDLELKSMGLGKLRRRQAV
jgi:acyl transferase domain-containing protein/acyl carrier protein